MRQRWEFVLHLPNSSFPGMESGLTVCPLWTMQRNSPGVELLSENPLGDTEGAQNTLSIALGPRSTLYCCKPVVGKPQEASLCLDWEIHPMPFLPADLLSKYYWWEHGECLYCRRAWNESTEQLLGCWSAPERASGSGTCWARAWQEGPHLNGVWTVKTSKIRTAEALPILIFKLMLAGRVKKLVWLAEHDKEHCFVATVCFVGLQETWGSLGEMRFEWL